MFKVVSVEHMRLIEAAADASGLSYDQMMENAGEAIADRALSILAGKLNARVVILTGPGNNGGDGLVAGRLIAEAGHAQVQFYMLKQRDASDPNFAAAIATGCLFVYAQADKDYRTLSMIIRTADLVIDALFGIGIRLPLRDTAAKLLAIVNEILRTRAANPMSVRSLDPAVVIPKPGSRPYVLAVDCPSGLDCDTGNVDEHTLHADETITFIAAKPGLLTFPGAAAVGKLALAAISVPADLPELQQSTHAIADGRSVRAMLPPRPLDSHKGTFGKALIIAGSANYIGAPGLSASAAYRAGAGLVTIGAPEGIVNMLAAQFLETTWLTLPDEDGTVTTVALTSLMDAIPTYNALLIGPGWGRDHGTQQLLYSLLSAAKDGAITLPPLVIDADGLNLLSEIDSWWTLLPSNTIITPHPREMARLTGLSTRYIQTSRWQVVTEKAQAWRIVVLLKGAHTLIASPQGHITALPFKNDALATAGTGDVLAGSIVGLLAQGSSVDEAAIAGGYIHGLAGEIAAEAFGSRSVIASDVTRMLPEALHRLEM